MMGGVAAEVVVEDAAAAAAAVPAAAAAVPAAAVAGTGAGGGEEGRMRMEGWLYLIRSNRLGLQYSRKRYFVLEDAALRCFKAPPPPSSSSSSSKREVTLSLSLSRTLFLIRAFLVPP
jgi:hypothetical protein